MGFVAKTSALILVLSVHGCSASFDGGGQAGFGGSTRKQTPKPSSDGKKSDCVPGTPDCLSADNGGSAVINRSITGFVFSGNGPGSCGLDRACGAGAQACPAGFVPRSDAASGRNLIMGDCFVDPATNKGRCYGNRQLCTQTGSGSQTASLDFQFFSGATCPAGWEAAGPAGASFHLFGQADQSGGYSQVVSCKKSIPKTDIKSGTKLITDVILMGIGERFPAAPECPAGYIQAGLMMDCVYGIGVTPAGTPGGSCSGQTRVCKKFEAVP